MEKFFKNKKLMIGLVILACVLVALKVSNFNPFLDKSNGYFKQVASMHYGRFKPVAVLLKDGNVLIFSSIYAEIYKTKENKFIKVNNSNKFVPNSKPSAFLLSNGKVLIMGWEILPHHRPQSSIRIFDPVTKLFLEEKKLENLVPYVPYTNIVFLNSKKISGNNDKIYIISGKKNISYDLVSNSLISLPSCIITRVGSTAIPINDRKILILGGRSSSEKDSKYISRTEIYDTVTNKFSLGPVFPEFKGSIPELYRDINFVTLKNNNVLILDNNRATIYDSKKNEFHSAGNLIKRQRRDFECILLKNEKVLIVGGVDGYEDSSKGILKTEIFDPKTEKFILGPKLLYPRKNHQLTLLDNGNVLVIGGEEELNPFNPYDLLLNTDIKLQKRAEIYIPPENN